MKKILVLAIVAVFFAVPTYAKFMGFLEQSTAPVLHLGPFVDATDGVTAETGLDIDQADVRLSKANGAFAAKNDATANAAHNENGYYDITLDATDTGTLGLLQICIIESGAVPFTAEFTVVSAISYNLLVDGTGQSLGTGGIAAASFAAGAIDAAALAASASLEIMQGGQAGVAATEMNGAVGGVSLSTRWTVYITHGAGSEDADYYPGCSVWVTTASGIYRGTILTYVAATDAITLASALPADPTNLGAVYLGDPGPVGAYTTAPGPYDLAIYNCTAASSGAATVVVSYTGYLPGNVDALKNYYVNYEDQDGGANPGELRKIIGYLYGTYAGGLSTATITVADNWTNAPTAGDSIAIVPGPGYLTPGDVGEGSPGGNVILTGTVVAAGTAEQTVQLAASTHTYTCDDAVIDNNGGSVRLTKAGQFAIGLTGQSVYVDFSATYTDGTYTISASTADAITVNVTYSTAVPTADAWIGSIPSYQYNIYKDNTIVIVSGKGAGQCRLITSYYGIYGGAGTENVCTIDSAWTVVPDATSIYWITGPGVPTAAYNASVLLTTNVNTDPGGTSTGFLKALMAALPGMSAGDAGQSSIESTRPAATSTNTVLYIDAPTKYVWVVNDVFTVYTDQGLEVGKILTVTYNGTNTEYEATTSLVGTPVDGSIVAPLDYMYFTQNWWKPLIRQAVGFRK